MGNAATTLATGFIALMFLFTPWFMAFLAEREENRHKEQMARIEAMREASSKANQDEEEAQ